MTTAKGLYDRDPLAGADRKSTLYFHMQRTDEFSNETSAAMNDEQLADMVAFQMGLSLEPILSVFSGILNPDTLVVDLSWTASDNIAVTGWIVKEDSTSLPLLADGAWVAEEQAQFTLTDSNLHTLTGRVRDVDGNISNPITFIVEPAIAADPTVDSFTTTSPSSDSQDYTFSLAATPTSPATLTDYILVEDSNVQPLAGDSGWVTWAGPYTDEAASLTSFKDTVVRTYVKDSTGAVSAGVASTVMVSQGGEVDPVSLDYLHANSPTIATFNSDEPIVYSGSGAMVIDGRVAAGTGGKMDGALATDQTFVHLIEVRGSGYTSIDISNLDLTNSRRCLIYLDQLSNCDITLRNCKLGKSNRLGQATNGQKKAFVANGCKNCTLKIYGSWFDKPDACIQLEDCDGTDIDIQYNFCNGMTSNGSDTDEFWKNLTNFFTGRNGNVTGKIMNNIYYAPNNAYSESQLEDVFNLHITSGTEGNPIRVERNRIWGGGGGSTGTCFQVGDKNYNAYVWIDENTAINTNGLFHFSLGHHHKFINNKGYHSRVNPSVGPGFSGQIQRRWLEGGKLHDCEVQNNTVLWWWDAQDGSALSERGIYTPVYGRDSSGAQGYPNHGQPLGDVNTKNNLPVTGLPNNVWSHSAWDNGQGSSELWRASWTAPFYAGADGLTPSIVLDSPWIGDGGSQNFAVQNVTSAAFGDGAQIDDIQTHDVLSLAIGGTAPYAIASVSTSTPATCLISNNTANAIFTAVAAGAFTYQVVLEDSTGAQATGTITGTVAGAIAERNYYDHDGNEYVCISFLNGVTPITPVGSELPEIEYFPRGGFQYLPRTGNSSPNGNYLQVDPYSSVPDVDDINDIETLSAEIVVHCNVKTAGLHELWINGGGLLGVYDTCWGGFNNVPHTDFFDIIACSTCWDAADWNWDDGNRGSGRATFTTTGANEKVALHIWVKDGGMAVAKLLMQLATEPDPTGVGPNESPVVKY